MVPEQATATKAVKSGGPSPSEPGWTVLHLYQRIDRSTWRALPEPERRAGIEELASALSRWQSEEGLQIVPIGASARKSINLLKNGSLKTYPGFSHGMLTVNADVLNPDLLAFIES